MGARRLQKVGWIFALSTKEREFIMSAEEVCQMAAVQAELGDRAVTGVVSMSVSEEGTPEIHFEAFQVLRAPGCTSLATLSNLQRRFSHS